MTVELFWGGRPSHPLDTVLDEREPDPSETMPVDCSIKWKGES